MKNEARDSKPPVKRDINELLNELDMGLSAIRALGGLLYFVDSDMELFGGKCDEATDLRDGLRRLTGLYSDWQTGIIDEIRDAVTQSREQEHGS